MSESPFRRWWQFHNPRSSSARQDAIARVLGHAYAAEFSPDQRVDPRGLM